MARLLFDIFYDMECISEDAFLEWLKNPDPFQSEGTLLILSETKEIECCHELLFRTRHC